MREVLKVNREGMVPLHSLPVLDFMSLWAFLYGEGPFRKLAISYSFWVVGIVVSFSISF